MIEDMGFGHKEEFYCMLIRKKMPTAKKHTVLLQKINRMETRY